MMNFSSPLIPLLWIDASSLGSFLGSSDEKAFVLLIKLFVAYATLRLDSVWLRQFRLGLRIWLILHF